MDEVKQSQLLAVSRDILLTYGGNLSDDSAFRLRLAHELIARIENDKVIIEETCQAIINYLSIAYQILLLSLKDLP